jgi:hypothetical protein
MKRLYLVALLGIGVLALAGCRRGGELGGNPEVTATAVDQGANLQLTWKSVEGADGYKVYCDGNKIWEGKDTTYKIEGSSRVCKEVEVSAFAGKDEQKTKIDLAPKSSNITDLISHDSPTGKSWVKLDLKNGVASSVSQSEASADKGNANFGFFVFYREGANVYFKDARHTTVGAAAREVAFTDNISSGNLAPGTGNYRTDRLVSSDGRYFFWVDQGEGSENNGKMDNNDYFGVIKVNSISGTGPYTANLTIYIQYKVPGLRWVVTE